ncbi:MAG: phage terminase large subunit family protein [Vicinamibacterales bacterium]
MTGVALKTHPSAVAEWERRRAAARRSILRPPPKLTISQWADQYRYVSRESSPEPGPWRTDRVPYMRGIMDTISDRRVRKICFMSSSQIGKTELILNVAGYYIDQEPSPILAILPTERPMAESFSRDRLATMIRDTPVLRSKVGARGDTLLHKSFDGGHITMAGANAPSGLASRPIRVLLPDEIDRYPASAGVEGDPLSLGEQRTENFTWSKKVVETSTPTIVGLSRIEKEWLLSDQRRYFVPCPECGHMQHLEWSRLTWEKRPGPDGKTEHHPALGVGYACAGCGVLIPETKKPWMLRCGEWRATRSADDGPGAFPGFHLNALYSPWTRWADLADEYLRKYKIPNQYQTFVNLKLGEPYDPAKALVDHDELVKRREVYAASPLPPRVLILTAGVDVQANRLEVEIVGWGLDFESWAIEYLHLPGDPTAPNVWQLLDHAITKVYEHPTGQRLRVAATAVDSGNWTQDVYRYVQKRTAMQVLAIKGVDGFGIPVMGRPWVKKGRKVPLYPVGVDEAKKLVYARLRVEKPEGWNGDTPIPGYSHFPERAPYEREHFRMLTAEKLVDGNDRNGYPTRRWVKLPDRRNEPLDIRGYATAALESLINAGLRLETLAERFRATPAAEPKARRTLSKGIQV